MRCCTGANHIKINILKITHKNSLLSKPERWPEEIPQPPTTQPKTKKSRKKKPPPKPIKKVNETLKKKYLLTCAAQHLTYLATSGQAKQLV